MMDIKLCHFIIMLLFLSSHIWHQEEVLLFIIPLHANRITSREVQYEEDRVLHNAQETQRSMYPESAPDLQSHLAAIFVYFLKAPDVQYVL